MLAFHQNLQTVVLFRWTIMVRVCDILSGVSRLDESKRRMQEANDAIHGLSSPELKHVNPVSRAE
jgi:hypothetical protein